MSEHDAARPTIQAAEEPPPDMAPPPSGPGLTPTPDGSPTEQTRSGIVKRAMEKTADKLSRSRSAPAKPQLSQSQPSISPPGHRRLFSLSRKGKEKLAADDEGKHCGPVTTDRHSYDIYHITSLCPSRGRAFVAIAVPRPNTCVASLYHPSEERKINSPDRRRLSVYNAPLPSFWSHSLVAEHLPRRWYCSYSSY